MALEDYESSQENLRELIEDIDNKTQFLLNQEEKRFEQYLLDYLFND
jgi:hypothetical protein